MAQPAPPSSPAALHTASATTTPAQLLGCWTVSIKLGFPMGTKAGELCFSQAEGDPLTARMFLKGKWRTVSNIQVDAARVDFVVDGPMGVVRIDTAYSAATMQGTATAKLGSFAFDGAKK